MKVWRVFLYLLGLIPWGFTISLLAFYLHAKAILGYFPKYSHPDPKELDIYNCYEPCIAFFGNLWICSILIWLILVICFFILNKKKILWLPIILGLIGQCCAIFLLFSRVMEWFAD